jgi:hypothetical protein
VKLRAVLSGVQDAGDCVSLAQTRTGLCRLLLTSSEYIGPCRPITNLLDHHRYPASGLATAYNQRLSSKLNCLKSTGLDENVPRAHTW